MLDNLPSRLRFLQIWPCEFGMILSSVSIEILWINYAARSDVSPAIYSLTPTERNEEQIMSGQIRTGGYHEGAQESPGMAAGDIPGPGLSLGQIENPGIKAGQI